MEFKLPITVTCVHYGDELPDGVETVGMSMTQPDENINEFNFKCKKCGHEVILGLGEDA